jgi:hypothetical protein
LNTFIVDLVFKYLGEENDEWYILNN